MPPPNLLGLDLGTSSFKALLLSATGQVLAVAAREYPLHTPQPGWAEQHPSNWYQAGAEAVRACLVKAQIPPRSVVAIGLSGQMHGTVCLDSAGQVIRPAVIWPDRRSAAQVDEIYTRVGSENLLRWTGNPLAAGFMLPTWLWLRAQEKNHAARTRTLLLPKDELRYRLTGELGTEPSDAASTGLFNPAVGEWSGALLAALDLDPRLLPTVAPSTAIAGALTRAAAAALGLPEGIPVVHGAADQACQALGQGVTDPGQLACTIGTGGQLLAPVDVPAPDPGLRLHLYPHAITGRWYWLAAVLSAGLSLRWLRDRILPGLSYTGLAELANEAPPGAEGLFFLPHLAGERTPHMDPAASGAWLGLRLDHDRSHLVRAVMEGVVFNLRQGLELMLALGLAPAEITASGGGARHPLWLQLQADIFNLPLKIALLEDAAALGAALLAGLGVGLFPDAAATFSTLQGGPPRRIAPDPHKVEFYADRYRQFVRLYPALKPLFNPPA